MSEKPEGARSEGEKKDEISFLCSARKLFEALSCCYFLCCCHIFCVKQLEVYLKLKFPQVPVSFCTHFICMSVNISYTLLESQCYREVAQTSIKMSLKLLSSPFNVTLCFYLKSK